MKSPGVGVGVGVSVIWKKKAWALVALEVNCWVGNQDVLSIDLLGLINQNYDRNCRGTCGGCWCIVPKEGDENMLPKEKPCGWPWGHTLQPPSFS